MLVRMPRLLLPLALLLALPAPAQAHGLAGPAGVPVPGFVFAWAAAIVLVGSFAALGALWRAPRLQAGSHRRGPALPPVLEPLLGLAGIAAFAWLVAVGLSGTQDPEVNALPRFVYVWFWVGLVPVCVLLGDVFAPVNPWRAAGRAAGWAARRLARRPLGEPLAYPAWLGRWPAVVTIGAFAWLELASGNHADPSTLAAVALIHAAVQLLGMALFGVEAWTRRGDGFAVYFGLFGRLALLTRRPLLAGAAGLEAAAGTTTLLCLMIGSTSFDGLSGTVVWREQLPDLEAALGSPQLAATAGLLAMTVLIAAVYRLGIAGMRGVTRDRSGRGPGRRLRPRTDPDRRRLRPRALPRVPPRPRSARPARGRRALVDPGRRAGRRARRRPGAGARSRPRPDPRPGVGAPVAAVDADGDGRLHRPGPLAALVGGPLIDQAARAGGQTFRAPKRRCCPPTRTC